VNDLCVVCVSLLSYLTAERCGDNVSNHPQCFVNDLTVHSQAPAVVRCSSLVYSSVVAVKPFRRCCVMSRLPPLPSLQLAY
jgi:hypothetical protein